MRKTFGAVVAVLALAGCGSAEVSQDEVADSTSSAELRVLAKRLLQQRPAKEAHNGGGGAVQFPVPLADGGTGIITSVQATFLAHPDGGTGSPACVITKQGDCDVRVCEVGLQGPGGSASDSIPVSAGDVHVLGGSGGVLTLKPDANNDYGAATIEHEGALWKAGQPLILAASGGPKNKTPSSVPAFVGGVPFPRMATFTSPVAGPGGLLVIDRSQPLTVAWNSFSSNREKIAVSLVQRGITINGKPGSVQLFCSFAPNLGTAAIPASLLSKFQVAQVPAFAVLQNLNEQLWNVGDYSVGIGATSASLLGGAIFQ